MNIIGWIGSILLAFCGIPQAYKCYKKGNTDGISKIFAFMWLLGEICFAIAVWVEFGFILWMMANYFINIISVLIILRYIIFPYRLTKK